MDQFPFAKQLRPGVQEPSSSADLPGSTDGAHAAGVIGRPVRVGDRVAILPGRSPGGRRLLADVQGFCSFRSRFSLIVVDGPVQRLAQVVRPTTKGAPGGPQPHSGRV